MKILLKFFTAFMIFCYLGCDSSTSNEQKITQVTPEKVLTETVITEKSTPNKIILDSLKMPINSPEDAISQLEYSVRTLQKYSQPEILSKAISDNSISEIMNEIRDCNRRSMTYYSKYKRKYSFSQKKRVDKAIDDMRLLALENSKSQ